MQWTALKGGRSFLTPAVGGKLMRDLCIHPGPDGVFHMVWTTGWWEKGIRIAHSKDLLTWSEQKSLPVMEAEPKALNCWAPEIFYDAPARQYLIFWSTTIPGRFSGTDDTGDQGRGSRTNHRIYYVTTRDFSAYSDTKLLYDDGFNVIDATIVQTGKTYVLFMKDETKNPVAKKNIRIATSNRAEGPYSHASEPVSPNWVEGPSALNVANSWILYFDEYTRHRYGAIRSKDLKQWEVISDSIHFPDGTRHGTAFAVSNEVLARLLALH